jgi:hypothetical protein
MLDEEARRDHWTAAPEALDHLCRRIGWLSPFYLNLLLASALPAARDPDLRARLLDAALLKLEEDGYPGFEGERVQFLSFLLRDYWKRNHA